MAQLTVNLTRPSFVPATLLTRHKFQEAADAGLLGDAKHLELIEGKVVRRVTQNGPHAAALRSVATALMRILPDGYLLSPQLPLAIDNLNQPEPDIAVIRGDLSDYWEDHPSTAVLVVEIAYSSLLGDRRAKAGLYALAGIPEYWIINLRDGTLELHRVPTLDSAAQFGARFQSVRTLPRNDEVSPLFPPDKRLAVRKFLPPLRRI